jgi:hypothetical protein
MATSIAVYTTGGQLVGRCDSRCHYATTKGCDCVCGGRFHGTGDDVAAIDKTQIDLSPQIQAFADRNHVQVDQLEVKVDPSVQMRLFDVGERQAA